MQDEFLAFIRENWDEVNSVFGEYYNEKAEEEGCDMQGDERYYGEEGYDYSPSELYEDFAHCTGHSATYHGAYGVIRTYADDFGDSCLDPEDEDLQLLVIEILEQEV
jgi:hypothetical protein